MKKWSFVLLCGLFLFVITGCGTSAASAESATESADATDSTSEYGAGRTVDMLYYLDLGEESIMAACYTPEGIAGMGEDYYVVHTAGARIFNAAGEPCQLGDLTRGCPIRVEWPGMVMESYPGQLSAEKITALSDEADPSVPPEEEIEPKGNGPKWWVPEQVTELPALGIEYTVPDFTTYMRVAAHSGSWSVQGEEKAERGASQNPRKWDYDDNNTIDGKNVDTVTLRLTPDASSIRVSAYSVDDPDKSETIPVAEDGSIRLLKGSYVYVVACDWSGGEYEGWADYGFLVTEESFPAG